MERVQIDPEWLKRLKRRIDDGEFRRDDGQDEDVTETADDRLEVCWVVARASGKVNWEFWFDPFATWRRGGLERVNGVLRHKLPEQMTRYQTKEAALDACEAVDETKTARPVAVMPRELAPEAASEKRSGRVAV